MKRVMILAVLVLGGCNNTPMTPEQQGAYGVERHCQDVGDLAQNREMGRLKTESKARGEWGSRRGRLIALQADKAGNIAQRECLISQGRDPFK